MDPATISLISAGLGLIPGLADLFTSDPYQPIQTGPRPGGPQRPQLGMRQQPSGPSPLLGGALDLALAGLNYGMQPDAGLSATPRAAAAQEEMRRMTQQTGAYPSPMATQGSVRPYAPMYGQYGGYVPLGGGY
jgi:hypothetical protein